MVQVKQTDDGDIDLSAGYLQWVEEEEEVRQHIISRINFIKGSFALNEDAGLPYMKYVLGKKDYHFAASIIKKWIQETPGVNSILEFDYDFSSTTRDLAINFKVNTIYGDIINGVTINT